MTGDGGKLFNKDIFKTSFFFKHTVYFQRLFDFFCHYNLFSWEFHNINNFNNNVSNSPSSTSPVIKTQEKIEQKKADDTIVHSSPVLPEGSEQLAAKRLESKLKSIPLGVVNKNRICTQKTTDDDNYLFLSQAGDRAKTKEVFEGKKNFKRKASQKKLSQRPQVSIYL
jgi:hypothetical protein